MLDRSKMEDAEIVDKARRIVSRADEKGITLRIMGATACRIHCQKSSSYFKELRRELSDIDFMAYGKQQHEVVRMFLELNYIQPKGLLRSFMHGRQFFTDPNRPLTVDIFFDELRMCHKIDFRNRLNIDYPTISLADLVLEKMQIVKLDEKDVKDMIVLFLEHDVGTREEETINSEYIAELLCDDWGFWRTVTINLDRVKNACSDYDCLTHGDRLNIKEKIDKLLEAIERKPKSFRWKLRAKIGTKKKWYTEIE